MYVLKIDILHGLNSVHFLTHSIRDSETSIDFVWRPPCSRRERVNTHNFFLVTCTRLIQSYLYVMMSQRFLLTQFAIMMSQIAMTSIAHRTFWRFLVSITWRRCVPVPGRWLHWGVTKDHGPVIVLLSVSGWCLGITEMLSRNTCT